jgi:NlpC/P60 family putative phage cell wall peptidase
MTQPERIMAEARAWIGTPYLHQASTRGAGADCLGLLRGVWRAVLGAEPEAVPAYTPDWAEPDSNEVLMDKAALHLTAKSLRDASVGDVLLFRMRDGSVAKHLGIQSAVGPAAAFIHAYTHHGVIESPLSLPWERRIAARFAFPTGAK